MRSQTPGRRAALVLVAWTLATTLGLVTGCVQNNAATLSPANDQPHQGTRETTASMPLATPATGSAATTASTPATPTP